MKTLAVTTVVSLTLCAALCAPPPLAASELVVVAATGVLEPAGVQQGTELAAGTRLRLEPWGRALIRETAKCGLIHVVAGVEEYVLEPSEDCSTTDEPMEVAGRVQRGDAFAARLEGSGQAAQLVAALAGDPCVFLPRFSEEPPARGECPSGFALRGLRCTGSHCDDKDLLCCPYLDGAPDPSAKQMNSRWISEEFPNSMQSKKFFNGLSCRGPYCDDLLASQFKSERLANAGDCEWGAWDSERPAAWLDCQPGRFVAGIRCRGDYCGDVSLYCCGARVE